MGTYIAGNKVNGIYINGYKVKGMVRAEVKFYEDLDPSTQAIINYANSNGYALPSNLTAFDNLIKGMKSCGIWALLDRFWLFSGDGSTDFKRINLIDVSKTRADFYGGLTISASGIQGNGTNAYVNTNFNPALLESGQKYQLNDASHGGIFKRFDSSNWEDNTITGNLNDTQNYFGLTNLNATRFNSGNNSSANTIVNSGLVLVNKPNNSQITIIQNNLSSTSNLNSTSIMNANETLLTVLGIYSKAQILCFSIGASIPFQVSQDFRTVFNTYLQAIGQTPIA